MHTTTQTATEARTLLYLLRGEEYPIDLPPIADLIDPSLFQNVFINFKGNAATATGLTKISKPYPNPANNQINIDYNLKEGELATISVFNLCGAEISTQQVVGNGTLQLATDTWNNGMYMYCIILQNGETKYGKIAILK